MAHTFADAVAAVREHIEYVKPTTEDEALEAGDTALQEYIDNALIYTSDVLELWDGNTHNEVTLSDYDDLMSAITASTYFQLREEWSDAVYDGIDAYIEDYLYDPVGLDRDTALNIINGTDD